MKDDKFENLKNGVIIPISIICLVQERANLSIKFIGTLILHIAMPLSLYLYLPLSSTLARARWSWGACSTIQGRDRKNTSLNVQSIYHLYQIKILEEFENYPAQKRMNISFHWHTNFLPTLIQGILTHVLRSEYGTFSLASGHSSQFISSNLKWNFSFFINEFGWPTLACSMLSLLFSYKTTFRQRTQIFVSVF